MKNYIVTHTFKSKEAKAKMILIIISMFFSLTALADMSDANKSKAWDCSGIYMANYFLPAGETFEYSMKEKSMASVKVLKAYALETGVSETNWDEGVNKAVDKYYGSKYDKAKTDACHSFVNSTVPDGEDRVKKVVQTLY